MISKSMDRVCLECGKEIVRRAREERRYFLVRKFCGCPCANKFMGRQRRKPAKIRKPKSRKRHPNQWLSAQRTKGEMFATSRSWQSARSKIQDHAVAVFNRCMSQKGCLVCGYDKHVHVAHIRPVSDFPDDVLIREINDPSNISGLCPNHHWEFDHGQITAEELQNLRRVAGPGLARAIS